MIGSGATALAVLDVVAARPGMRVTLIRPEKRLQPQRVEETAATLRNDAFAAMIRSLRGELGLKFPPPKTHFGNVPLVRLRARLGPDLAEQSPWRANAILGRIFGALYPARAWQLAIAARRS